MEFQSHAGKRTSLRAPAFQKEGSCIQLTTMGFPIHGSGNGELEPSISLTEVWLLERAAIALNASHPVVAPRVPVSRVNEPRGGLEK